MALALSAVLAALWLAGGRAAQAAPKVPAKAVCAVVREKSGPEAVAAVLEYQGKTYYFCKQQCKDEFQQGPEKWIRLARESKPRPEAGRQHEGGSAAPS